MLLGQLWSVVVLSSSWLCLHLLMWEAWKSRLVVLHFATQILLIYPVMVPTLLSIREGGGGVIGNNVLTWYLPCSLRRNKLNGLWCSLSWLVLSRGHRLPNLGDHSHAKRTLASHPLRLVKLFLVSRFNAWREWWVSLEIFQCFSALLLLAWLFAHLRCFVPLEFCLSLWASLGECIHLVLSLICCRQWYRGLVACRIHDILICQVIYIGISKWFFTYRW